MCTEYVSGKTLEHLLIFASWEQEREGERAKSGNWETLHPCWVDVRGNFFLCFLGRGYEEQQDRKRDS